MAGLMLTNPSHIDTPPNPTTQIPVVGIGGADDPSTQNTVVGVRPDWGSDAETPTPDNPLEDYMKKSLQADPSPTPS